MGEVELSFYFLLLLDKTFKDKISSKGLWRCGRHKGDPAPFISRKQRSLNENQPAPPKVDN